MAENVYEHVYDAHLRFYPYAQCLADRIYQAMDPEVPENVLSDIVDIFFHDLFSCPAAQPPCGAYCELGGDLVTIMRTASTRKP